MKKRMDETVHGEMAIFVRGYARKAQRGEELNDQSEVTKKNGETHEEFATRNRRKLLNDDDDPEFGIFLVFPFGSTIENQGFYLLFFVHFTGRLERSAAGIGL